MTRTVEGFAQGKVRAIPSRTLREAIVNGLVHRDWLVPRPTVIEHVGDTLTVTSSGGFVGGVTPDNIITHPAVPRYRNLSEAMAALGLAEREGIGVDRMVRDMLAIGRPAPVISEIDGPHVRVVLLGGDPDAAVIDLVAALIPARAGNVESLLLIAHMTRRGWGRRGVRGSASPAIVGGRSRPGDPQTGGCALGRRRLSLRDRTLARGPTAPARCVSPIRHGSGPARPPDRIAERPRKPRCARSGLGPCPGTRLLDRGR